MVSDGLPALLLPYAFVAAGSSAAADLGAVTLVAIAVAALIQPAAGAWSDRVGRLPAMAAGTAAVAIGLGAIVLDPRALGIGSVIALGGVSVAQAGQQALLPDRAPRAWHGRGGGLKGAFDVGGALLAFALLAPLLDGGNLGAGALVLGGGLAAAMLLAGLLLRGTVPALRPRAGTGLADRYRLRVAVDPRFVAVIAARFLFLLGIYAVGRFLLLFVAETLGVAPETVAEQTAFALATLAATTVVASLPAGWAADRFGRRALMLGGGLLATVGIGLLPLASSIEAILAFGGLMAVGSAAFGAASWAALADLADGPDAGGLLGIANFGTAGAAAGAGAFGWLIDGAGFGAAFAVAAGCAAAGGLLAALPISRRYELEPSSGSAEGRS